MNGNTYSSELLDVESRKREMFESYISRLRQQYSQKQVDPLLATLFLSNLEKLALYWETLPTKPKNPPLDYKKAKNIRTEAGLSITQLVALLGHPKGQCYISRYERGKTSPIGSHSAIATKYLAWLSEHGYKKA
ncbi:MAG TPA: helix-turn-helix transcriptional regulator [Candidatus Nanoarchaeia archaeon]|nr:helix-turn-helix transcriptional regulator [Candidatus Nanoarchaeia archaeon]